MAQTGTVIVIIAGTMTFGNEWYETGHINWRIPVATALAAGVMDGLSHLAPKAATGLGVMVLIGAAVTRFNGQSVADTLMHLFTRHQLKQAGKPAGTIPLPPGTTRRAVNVA